MACRIVVGNLLEDAEITMDPAEDANFPAEFLHDGPGAMPARFSTLAADPEIIMDLNHVPGGDGSVPGAAVGDVIGSSDPDVLLVDLETDWIVRRIGGSSASPAGLQMIDDAAIGFFANDHGGNDRLLMLGTNSGSGLGAIAFTRKAGARLKVNGWCVNGGSATTGAAIRLYCVTTGLWLKPDGTWADTEQDLVTDATTDHVWLGINAGAGLEFEVPLAVDLTADEADLEFQIVTKDASGVTFFDDLSIVSAADFMAVLGGHTITPALGPLWESSDDGSSWTLRATFTVRRSDFYATLDAPLFARFHRLAMTGTPVSLVWLGDLVLGLFADLPRSPRDSIQLSYPFTGQERSRTPGGTEWVANRGPVSPRTLVMTFRFADAAETAEALDLLLRLQGGAEACVFLPETNDLPDVAIYGRLEGGLALDIQMRSGRQGDDGQEYFADLPVTIVEAPVSSIP